MGTVAYLKSCFSDTCPLRRTQANKKYGCVWRKETTETSPHVINIPASCNKKIHNILLQYNILLFFTLDHAEVCTGYKQVSISKTTILFCFEQLWRSAVSRKLCNTIFDWFKKSIKDGTAQSRNLRHHNGLIKVLWTQIIGRSAYTAVIDSCRPQILECHFGFSGNPLKAAAGFSLCI